MTYLLDTHAFLWAAFSPESLSPAASKEIRLAENRIYLSTISLWEISLKYTLGKILWKIASPTICRKSLHRCISRLFNQQTGKPRHFTGCPGRLIRIRLIA